MYTIFGMESTLKCNDVSLWLCSYCKIITDFTVHIILKKNVADIRFEYELITLPKLTCMCKRKPENLCTGNKEDKDEELGLVFVKVLFV